MSYHGCKLREGRFSEFNRPYLITTVTHERIPLFSDFDIARLLIGQLRISCNEFAIESLAWVVMPDHLHWLFVLNKYSISEVVGRFKGKSAYRINKVRGLRETLWQRGCHDHAITKEEDIEHVARYIISNPLRAGLVEKIGDYPHWDAVWL